MEYRDQKTSEIFNTNVTNNYDNRATRRLSVAKYCLSIHKFLDRIAR